MYACDRKWWEKHLPAIKRDFRGELNTQFSNTNEKKWAEANGITAMPGAHADGLGSDRIHYGSNSGVQAIGLCWLLTKGQVTHINLLGYDMGQTGGKNHWFGDHPKGMTNGNYSSFICRYDKLAKDLAANGVTVTNYTRTTNLNQFKRASLDDI